MRCPRCGGPLTTYPSWTTRMLDGNVFETRRWRCEACPLSSGEYDERDRIRDVVERSASSRSRAGREEPELHADDSEGGTI